jgi:RNA polymerase sigma-70 factor (ECF subfamily)
MTRGYSLELPVKERVAGVVDAEVVVDDLVRAYASLLFRVAHSILRNRAEAEDVVQEVFLRVMERPMAGVRDWRVWLVRMAWNRALDQRKTGRAGRPEQREEGFWEAMVAPGLAQDEALGERGRMEAVLEEMDRLPKKERQVLLLSAMEELGTTEIAGVMERSESAVRALLFRARTRLRERLEGRKR